MIRAYDETYLEDAMLNFGVMLDYGALVCPRGLDGFNDRMLACNAIREFEKGNPRYIAGMSGIELAFEVICSTGGECGTITYVLGERSDIFWTGWASAYLQWFTGSTFRSLDRHGMSVQQVRRMYPAFHEADLSKFTECAIGIMERSRENGDCPLKRQRKLIGLTQKELAEQSGVSLRMIQAYEQKDQDISKAEARAVLRLSSALGCDPKILLD